MADDDVVLPKGFGLPGGKIPSAEDLLAAVEKLGGLSEENKEELRRSILRGAAGKMAEGFVPPAAAEVVSGTGTQILILLGLILLVFSVILFVGYKLYISLIVRQREKEEKRRQKQLKKKK